MRQIYASLVRSSLATRPQWWRCRGNRRGLSQLLQVPLIFSALFVTLWTWKSCMLILFQKKIIYMPYLGRHETLEAYPTPGVKWHQESIQTSDGVTLALLRSQILPRDGCVKKQEEIRHCRGKRRSITVVYLQGNASSTPPRLPALSKILLAAQAAAPECNIIFWTISYRGYWHSTGRPSEAGLVHDVQESLQHIIRAHERDTRDTLMGEQDLIIWGHSIGASLAIMSLTHLLTAVDTAHPQQTRVHLILETPFDSAKSVLQALYPQKWLPYRYLSPFLTTRLDVPHALSHLTAASTIPHHILKFMQILVIVAERDEIVPMSASEAVISAFQAQQIGIISRHSIRGGLHQDCLFKPQLQKIITECIKHKSI